MGKITTKTDNIKPEAERAEAQEHAGPKRIQIKVKRRGLADFLVKLRGDGSGELTCVFAKEDHEFNDINDMLRLIEGQCNAMSYPQPQRKMRNWDSKY